ncbi:hypothetical protein [Nodosilinea nodulosa]|uniref:hypothetical protein n=1 Tax=Nodosilinea nodulosa TaxID=416001 RepID=UPI000316322B|nr:hypothetical protein [Nodosilinea nodulosa]
MKPDFTHDFDIQGSISQVIDQLLQRGYRDIWLEPDKDDLINILTGPRRRYLGTYYAGEFSTIWF